MLPTASRSLFFLINLKEKSRWLKKKKKMIKIKSGRMAENSVDEYLLIENNGKIVCYVFYKLISM